jgi:hypothetical protein
MMITAKKFPVENKIGPARMKKETLLISLEARTAELLSLIIRK